MATQHPPAEYRGAFLAALEYGVSPLVPADPPVQGGQYGRTVGRVLSCDLSEDGSGAFVIVDVDDAGTMRVLSVGTLTDYSVEDRCQEP